jgi:outer membrane protein assembly factor BamB
VGAGHANWALVIVGDVLFSCTITRGHPPQDIVAMRIRDGKELWRTPLSSGSGFIDVLGADATAVVVNADEQGLCALDAANGSIRWHQPVAAAGRPSVRHGIVYAILIASRASDPDALAAFRLGDGTVLR